MKHIAAAAFALTLAIASTHALAGDGPKNPEKHMDRLTEELSLSPDQRDRVAKVFEAKHEEHKAARDKMHEEMKAALAPILTPEQMTKFDNLHDERMASKEERKKERRAERKGEHMKGKPEPESATY